MTAPRAQHRPPPPPDRLPSPRGGHPSPSTASAAARPAGFARLAGVALLALFGGLALFGALALPATAQVQTTTTFVSNLEQTDDTGDAFISDTRVRGQQFETGSNSRGYTLTEIVVNIRDARTGTPAFALYTSTSDDKPDTKVVDLNGDSSTAGEQSFTPASATTLSASTKYIIAFYMTSGSANLQRTASDDIDSGAWPGWNINTTALFSNDSGTTFSSSGNAVEIAVKGTAVTCPLNTGDLWCGEVTVAALNEGTGTFGHGFLDADPDQGALSDTTFSVGTNDYTIDLIYVDESLEGGFLQFSLTSNLTAADKATLVLHIDGSSDTFAFSPVAPNAVSGYEWEDTGLDWSSTSTVTLRLREGTGTPMLSTDATLRDLVVYDDTSDLTLTPTFASDTETYTASVANDVAEVGVTATPSDSGASIDYLDGSDMTLDDANTLPDDGHQVTLAEGDNVIKVKVTAADGSTKTYTVTVNRAAAASTCTLNTGDLWCGVVTVEEVQLSGTTAGYGFGTSAGALSDTGFTVGTNDYTIDAVMTGVSTLAGQLLFGLFGGSLSDADKAKLVLYVDGHSDSFEFMDAGGPSPTGVYNWVSSGLDWTSTSEVTLRLREVTRATIANVAVTSTPLLTSSDGSTTHTYGVGETIELSVTFNEAVNATSDTDFVLSVGGARRAALLSGSGTATLVFGYTVLAADVDANGIWIGDQDRTLVGDRMSNPQTGAITSVGTGVKADLTHSALNTLGGHRVDGGRSIVLVEVTSTPMLETDTYGADETIRFTVTFNAAVDVTGDPVSTFSLGSPGSIRNVNAAYESGTGTAELVFGYTVLSTDMDSNGIYQLGGETDFSTVKGPVGLDADDAIQFTGTSADAPLAYPVRAQRSGHKVDGSQTVVSTDATLSALTMIAAGTNLLSFVSGGPTSYGKNVAYDVDEVTFTATPNHVGATIEYLDGSDRTLNDADTSDDGHQVALEVGNNNVIKVKVTAEDGVTTKTYTVTVSRAEASTDATLTDLVVNDGTTNLTLTPTFASGMYTYTARVVNTVAEVTVTPTKSDINATIEYLDGSDMTLDDAGTDAGHQVAVAVGETVIKVKVTAQDGNTTQTYTVTVSRAAAPTCTLNAGDLWCGAVTVSRFALGVLQVDGFGSGGGDLSDKDFMYGTNSYTIDLVATQHNEEILFFSLNSALTSGDRAGLAVHVDGSSDTFAFGAATYVVAGGSHQYTWTGTGLSWSGSPTTTVRLREVVTGPAAPTNFMVRPAGDAKVALSWDAPASDSGVTRHEYQFKTDGSYGNWARDCEQRGRRRERGLVHGVRAHQRGAPHLPAPRGERRRRRRRGDGGSGHADPRHLRPHAAGAGRNPEAALRRQRLRGSDRREPGDGAEAGYGGQEHHVAEGGGLRRPDGGDGHWPGEQQGDLTPRDRVLRPDGAGNSQSGRQLFEFAPCRGVLRPDGAGNSPSERQRSEFAPCRGVLRPDGAGNSLSVQQRSEFAPRDRVLRALESDEPPAGGHWHNRAFRRAVLRALKAGESLAGCQPTDLASRRAVLRPDGG